MVLVLSAPKTVVQGIYILVECLVVSYMDSIRIF